MIDSANCSSSAPGIEDVHVLAWRCLKLHGSPSLIAEKSISFGSELLSGG